MSLLKSLKNIFVETNKDTFYNEAVRPYISGDYNEDFNLTYPEKLSVVYTSVKILAENVARLPLTIKKKTDKGKIEYDEHPLYNLIRYQVNDYLCTSQYLNSSVANLYFQGNSFDVINKEKGYPLELRKIHTITDAKVYNNQLFYYDRENDQVYHSKDVIHYKLLSKNGLMGLNPIESARLSVNLNYKSETTVDKFYSNNANSTKVLQTVNPGNNLTKFKEAVDQWKKNQTGFDKSGEILDLPVGTELKELKLSVEDSKFLETAAFSTKSLGALFGVPLQLLGHGESKYSDFEQSALNFKVNTLASLLSLIKNELEFKLLSIEDRKQGISIEFDTKALIETSLTDKANYYHKMLMMGAASIDEIAIENGFQVLGGDIGRQKWMQKQMNPVQSLYDSAMNNNNNIKTDQNG